MFEAMQDITNIITGMVVDPFFWRCMAGATVAILIAAITWLAVRWSS